jgi:hypothetical protein
MVMKLNFFFKMLLLLYFLGIGSSFYGCLRCPENQYFSIDTMDLSLFWDRDLEADQQYRDYIGIDCTLSNSKSNWAFNNLQPFTFINSAFAWSCDTEYYLKDLVKTIRIITIHDLQISDKNQSYEAGSDITELILFTGTYGLHFAQNIGVEDLIIKINTQKYYFDPIISFNAILNHIVEGEFADFEFEITFEGGQSFTDQTDLIRLVDR